MNSKSLFFLSILVLCFSFVSCGIAEELKIDPKAKEVVQKASDYLKSLSSFSVDAVLLMKMDAGGLKQEYTNETALACEKPGKLSLKLKKNGVPSANITSDGENVYTYIPLMGKYTVKKFPGSLAALSEQIPGEIFPVSKMLISLNPYNDIIGNASNATYVRTDKVGELECHQLRFSQDDLSWDYWISAGDQPLILKIVPDFSKALGKITGANEKEVRQEIVIVLANWKTNTPMPEGTFNFTAPEKAEKVESFKSDAGTEGEDKGAEFLGKQAVDFKVRLLDGSEFQLFQIKGKKIIVLEFWTSWIPACRKSLPLVVEAVASFKDQGVELITVNQGENKETIEKFLNEKGIKCAVGMDLNSSLCDRYGVRITPYTFVIGMDGAIQSVHIGLIPDIKEKLTAELEKLIKGEKLLNKASEKNEKKPN